MKHNRLFKGLLLLGALAFMFTLAGCGAANNAEQPPAGQPAGGGNQAAPGDQGGNQAAGTFDEAAAKNTLAKAGCTGCHGADLKGQGNSPDLTNVGDRLTADQIFDILTNGQGGGMPGGLVPDENERKNLAAYLASQK